MRNSHGGGGELNYRTQNLDRRSLELGQGGTEGAAGGGGGDGGGAVAAVGEDADADDEEGPGEIMRTESDWERIHLVKQLRKDLDMR